MPQLDDIDIFDRDHMTVQQFDPQGNPIGTKIIFSRSVEDTPIFDSAEEQFSMDQLPYFRMIDPTTGAFVEVQNYLPTILSYIEAGYQPEMPPSGPGGSVTRIKRRARRGKSPYKKPGRRKGSVSDKEYESFRDSLKNQDIFEYNKYSLGGSVSEMMGRTGPDLTPAQIANLAGAFADPYGGADLTGNYPEFPARDVSVEEMLRGPRAPSFLQNLREGNFGSAALQGIGAIPVLGGMSKVLRGASRAGRTPPDPRMLRAAEQGFDTSTVYYHATDKLQDGEEFKEFIPSVKGKLGPGVYAAKRPEDTERYIRNQYQTGTDGPMFDESSRILPIFVRGKMGSIEDYGRASDQAKELLKKEFDEIDAAPKNNEFDQLMANRKKLAMQKEKAQEILSGEGFSGFELLDQVVIFDPKNIRSVNAKFADDPDSPPLLRSEGGIVEDVDIFGADQGMYRADGAKKSARGFIGPIRNLITGGTMTEFSTDMEYDGRKIQIPTMVPTLSQEEIGYMQRMEPGKGWDMSNPLVLTIINKARAHARKRLDEGKNPFYQDDEGYLQNLQEFSLGGSVGDMIREQAGISREDVLTPAQLANIAGGFVDPYGSADIAGMYPEFPDRDVTIEQMADPNYPRSPSAAENLAQGDYLNLLFQGFGALPFVGGAIKGIRALGKMPPSIVDPLTTDASGLLTGRTGFGPEAELAQAKDTPPQLARIIDDESVLQKQYAKDLTVPELSKLANKKSAASFLNFMDTFPAAREMATVAQAGLAKKGWYRQSAQALYDVFGDEAPRFAALLAATSPQTSVQGNLLNATSIWRNLTQNNMPRDPVLFDIINEPGVAAALKLKKNVPLKNADGTPQLNKAGNQKYGLRNISEQEAREVIKKAGGGDSTFDVGRMQIEIMGDAVQGEKGAESVLDAWVSNSIRAINVPDNEMDKLVLSGPKVDSFMRNLVNNTVEVTNDTWMANYLGVEQNVFGGSLNPARIDPGKGPGYLAANALTRNASRILSDRIGENVTPEMIQEMVWSWSKAVFEQSRAVGMSPREFIQKGRLTDAMINDVPDFSSLLRDPDLPYRGILKASGATVGQFKKGEIPKGNRTEEIMKSSDTARRNLERAANRLKFIKADQLALGAIVPLIAINIVNMGKVPDEEEGSSEIDNIDIFN